MCNPRRRRGPVGLLIALSFALVGCAHDNVAETAFLTPESAIQQAIAEELGMPVTLRVEVFAAHGNWVFVAGRPLTLKQTPIDYAQTPYAEDLAEGYFDDNFLALVKRCAGADAKWRVVELTIGATDAPFVDWPARYGLPRTLVMPGSDPE